MKKDNLPNFSRKCISMNLIDSEHSHDLNNPKFEYQGNHLLIVGTIPVGSTDSGWDANKIGAINWTQVSSYVLFENIESYSNAIKVSESFHSKK